jgi:Fe2+ or Zn2+ uptake regulation protein
MGDGARAATMTDPESTVSERLHTAGLSPTFARRRILDLLDGTPAALSATEVHGALRVAGDRIAFATVYRVLRALADAGLVHVFVGEEVRYHACASWQHAHLVCERCRLVIEEPTDTVRDRLISTRARDSDIDFEINLEHSLIYGVCGPCLSPNASAAPE